MTADDIARLGGRVVDVSRLTVTPTSTSRIFLGHYGGEGFIVGGSRIPAPNAGLQLLEGWAKPEQYGGRVLNNLSGNIKALKSAILSADEIIFNVGARGIRSGSLTAQEFELIRSAGMLDKAKFVVGATY